jgi:hypothetical protein
VGTSLRSPLPLPGPLRSLKAERESSSRWPHRIYFVAAGRAAIRLRRCHRCGSRAAHEGTLAPFVVGLLLCVTSALIAFVVAARVTIDMAPASH